MKKKILISLVVGIFSLGLTGNVAATQISVTAQNDWYYNHDWWTGGHINQNFNNTATILTTYRYEPGSGGDYNQMHLKFDLSSLGSINVSDITGATLNLNITSAYNNAGGSNAGTISYKEDTQYVSTSDSGWTSFDILSPLTAGLTLGDTSANFSGNFIGVYAGAGYKFTSAEEGHPAYLEITTVPVPATILLFGSGLLGLIGVARRKSTIS